MERRSAISIIRSCVSEASGTPQDWILGDASGKSRRQTIRRPRGNANGRGETETLQRQCATVGVAGRPGVGCNLACKCNGNDQPTVRKRVGRRVSDTLVASALGLAAPPPEAPARAPAAARRRGCIYACRDVLRRSDPTFAPEKYSINATRPYSSGLSSHVLLGP